LPWAAPLALQPDALIPARPATLTAPTFADQLRTAGQSITKVFAEFIKSIIDFKRLRGYHQIFKIILKSWLTPTPLMSAI